MKIPPAIEENRDINFELATQYNSHKDDILAITLDSFNNIITTSKDGIFKFYSSKEKRQIRSVQISVLPLSSVQIISNSDIIFGCWDDSM
jgi:hypothetical protein